MKTKAKNKSKILEAVYETMTDFHSAGVIDDERMNAFKEMCLEPQPIILDADVLDYLNQKCDFNPEKIRVLINDWLRKDIEIARSVS
jgi:NAD(P)H-hydrate repair Nnr-like enzyme with NAD(P)H-hydrate dehydratase domain